MLTEVTDLSLAIGGHDAIYSSTILLVYDSLLCCSMCIEENARTSLPGSTGFGGGFFLAARILGEGSANYSPPPLFPKKKIFHTNSTLYTWIRSPVAQQAETTVAECSLMSCV